ncbi:MAG: hypothetical protein CMO36_02485 [Verrucomicrobiaceae bacterium]|nr:hypothetical protein [Verrucomicrobiaceae bacterium]
MLKNKNDEEIREIALNKDDMRLLFNVLNNFYRLCRGHKDNLTPIDFVKAKELREKLSLCFDDVMVFEKPGEKEREISQVELQDTIDDMTIVHDHLDDKNWSMAEPEQFIKRHQVEPDICRVGNVEQLKRRSVAKMLINGKISKTESVKH